MACTPRRAETRNPYTIDSFCIPSSRNVPLAINGTWFSYPGVATGSQTAVVWEPDFPG